MFNLVYTPRYGDFKDFDSIKPSAILDMVQDIAVRHSDSRGYGMHKLRDMGYAWLLNGIKLHIEKPINPSLPIEISTAIKDMKGLFSERGCIIKQSGEVVAKTCASWFIFNTELGKPCRAPEEIASAYENHDFCDEFFEFKKIKFMEAERIGTLTVSNKDIDTNRHLNNQKSAELLMDALPFDYSFTDMTVLYKKAAYLGDCLDLCVKTLNDGYYVHLASKDGTVCVAGIFK